MPPAKSPKWALDSPLGALPDGTLTAPGMSGEHEQSTSLHDLIARAKAGDRLALEKVFQWCQPLLDHWAAHRLAKRQPGIARPSDIAQETAMRAYRSFSSFEGTTEEQLLAWLSAVLETCTTQAFRDAGRQKRDIARETRLDDQEELGVPAPQASPSQATAAEEEWQIVLSWIFQLPEDQKNAIWLCHLKEMRVAEAAARMGKSEPAVAGLLQRGLRTLRDRWSNEVQREPLCPPPAPPEQGEAAAALLSYLRRRDAGERVDAAAFAAEHPSCADDLRAMLAWIERIHALRLTGRDE